MRRKGEVTKLSMAYLVVKDESGEMHALVYPEIAPHLRGKLRAGDEVVLLYTLASLVSSWFLVELAGALQDHLAALNYVMRTMGIDTRYVAEEIEPGNWEIRDEFGDERAHGTPEELVRWVKERMCPPGTV